MKFLILFIFNIFTITISNHIKFIPELCKAGTYNMCVTLLKKYFRKYLYNMVYGY